MMQKIVELTVRDVRFPTSLEQHGSDAMHTDPDYSVAYVVLHTDRGMKGFGLTFTVGRGTEIVVCAVQALAGLVVGKSLQEIVSDFRGFYRLLTSDGQMRWIGPEKGVIQLATAAVLNAVWDLWARAEGKPLWKLLADMDPRQIISCIDFRYITDALTEQEALEILLKAQEGKQQREDEMLREGYPAYTTSCAWLGYSDQQLQQLCTDALNAGWTRFKVKVGADLQDDKRRCLLMRQMIGPSNTLMMDANQRWDVAEAISWVSSLAEFKPLWIEEPTSPDDVLGHAAVSKALAPLGIGVASGEQCHNRVMFKQFLQASALQFVQIDSCRLGSVNENLAVLLMAHKFQVPVCPHAGGVGLCELVQHLILFDFISVSANLSNRMCEYVDHLHEHFASPVVIRNARYMPPKDPGYSCEMLESSVQTHRYPDGDVWRSLNINSSAIWGCDHEKTARETYEAWAAQQYQDPSVCDAGLYIDLSSRAYLGASPDGLLSCTCCGDGILEIKCPHCAKDSGVHSATENKLLDCIENVDGTHALKRDHQYYYQVQAQLFVTKRKYCDFVVWSATDFFLQRILSDADLFTEAVQNVELFYRLAILPELLAKKYTCPDRLLSDTTQSTDSQGLEE